MNIIKIPAPPVQRFYIDITPGSILDMEFNPAGASFDRVENDVVITLADGYTLFLLNFFITAVDTELPLVALNGQPPVDGGTFLLSVNPYMDISPIPPETASPPQDSPVDSNGIGAYSDSAGELIAGLDGSQAVPLAADSGSGIPQGVLDIIPTSGQIGATGGSSGGTVQPPPPPPPQGDYNARAVAYAAGSATETRFRLLDSGGSPVADSAGQSFSATSLNGYFDLASLAVYPDGSISYAISADGASALAAAAGADIFDYIAFNYGGRTYTMQIVISAGGVYDTAAAEADGWAPNALYGEWHYGGGQNTQSAITGTAGNDEVWFYNVTAPGIGTSFSGTLNLLGGNDKVTAHGGEYGLDGAGVSTGGGADVISISAEGTAVRDSVIDAGAGADVVKISGGFAGVESAGQSSIIAHEGSVEISAAPDSGQGQGAYVNTAGAALDIEAPKVSVSASGNTASALAGLYSSGGAIDVSSGTARPVALNIDVEQNGNSSAYGVYAGAAGEIDLTNVAAQSGKEMIGVYSEVGPAYAVYNNGSAVNISGDPGSADLVTMHSHSNTYYSRTVANYGTTRISDFQNLRLEASGNAGQAVSGSSNAALFNSGSSSELTVTDVGKLHLVSTLGGSGVYGAYNDGITRLGEAGSQIGELVVEAHDYNNGSYASGAQGLQNTNRSGSLSVVAGKIQIDVTSDNGNARGISSEGGAHTVISSDGALDLSVNISAPANSALHPYSNSYAIYTGRTGAGAQGSLLEIIGGQGGAQADVINITGGGVIASHGGTNKITTGAGDDLLNLYSLTARGVPDAQTGNYIATYNYIDVGAGDNTITVNGGGIKAEAFGYNEFTFSGGGNNTVSGGDIAAKENPTSSHTASNHFHNADAASAFNITFGTSVDPIDIITGLNGSNLIDTAANNQNDNITVYGGFTVLNAGAGYGNAVSTLGGDDNITIHGGLSAQNTGRNLIEAGDGNDTVTVNGDITSSGTAFNDIDGGSGYDVFEAGALTINSGYSYSLSNLAGILDGFERLSLGGGGGTALSIDALLDGMNIDGRVSDADFSLNTTSISFNNDLALFISGDAGSDSITLTGTDWNAASHGYVIYDSVRYDVYSDNTDTTYLLIQHGLI